MDYKVGYKKGVVLWLMEGITPLGCIGPGPVQSTPLYPVHSAGFMPFISPYMLDLMTFARSAIF
ncbi:hypothetical protein BSK62_17400 [Paenibacillus odorifer]|nr:hypothetical protein BSK62_17400 [Paenibacillus odorifer]